MICFEGFPVGCVDAVLVSLSAEEEVVELVLHLSCAEGEVANDEGEQDDSHGEDISLLSIIALALANFWSHIALSSSEGNELLDVLVSGEAEVGQLEVHVVVDQDVLELDVSVNNILAVNVLELFDHLFGKKSSNILAAGSNLFAEIEEEWALNILHNNVDLLLEALAFVMDNSAVSELVELDNAFVVKILEDLHFFFNSVCGVLKLQVGGAHDFDCELQ